MNWLWLNVPLMAVFFLAMAGIPLWLVFKHPDTGPAAVLVQAPRTQEAPVGEPARGEPASWRARAGSRPPAEGYCTGLVC